MLQLFAVLLFSIPLILPLIVIGGIAELVACALGFLDPWDYR